MTLRKTLLVTLCFIGLVPVGILAVSSLLQVRQAIEHEAFGHLEATKNLKKDTMERYLQQIRHQIASMASSDVTRIALRDFSSAFDTYAQGTSSNQADTGQSVAQFYRQQFLPAYRELTGGMAFDVQTLLAPLDDNSLALQADYIVNNPNPLGEKGLLDRATVAHPYNDAHERWHEYYRDYLNRFGYYDIFLVSAGQANVVYSVFKEIDFATSLETGAYADSGIADAYRQAMSLPQGVEAALVDFAPYVPSYDAPAGFLGAPIVEQGETIGVLIFQFPVERVNEIMRVDGGFGDSGESYLVGEDGLMRSTSALDPMDYSVEASFRNAENRAVRTGSVTAALSGETGSGFFQGRAGNAVLATYAPIEARGINWAIVSELDEANAFAPVTRMLWQSALTIGALVVLVIVVAFYITRKVIRPLGTEPTHLATIASTIANGDLSEQRMSATPTGVLKSMQEMTAGLRSLIGNVIDGSHRQASASQQLATITTQTRQSVERQTEQTDQVAAAIEQMSVSISEVSQNTQEATQLVDQAHKLTEHATHQVEAAETQIREMADDLTQANHSIQDLRNNMAGISQILETINTIAEQTNLLALNAAIEAARAGDHGRGFAVVADEVRSLAKNTKGATEQIENTIQVLFSSSDTAVDITNRATEQAQSTCDAARAIASQLQSNLKAMDQVAQMTTQIAAATEQQSGAAEQVTRSISTIAAMCAETDSAMAQIAEASDELAHLAETMQESISTFKL